MASKRWLLSDNPDGYGDYHWYCDELPPRKFYLFLTELGRRLRHLMTDPGPAAMLALCERCAEGWLSEDDLGEEGVGYRPRGRAERFSSVVVNQLFCFVPDRYKVGADSVDSLPEALGFEAAAAAGVLPVTATADEVAASSSHPVFAEARSRAEREWGQLVRDIYGPDPYSPIALSGGWRTSTVVSLAQQMYESRDFSAMPILADALQDAGCDNGDILNHCRRPGVHVRGCWVVDLVLGKV